MVLGRPDLLTCRVKKAAQETELLNRLSSLDAWPVFLQSLGTNWLLRGLGTTKIGHHGCYLHVALLAGSLNRIYRPA